MPGQAAGPSSEADWGLTSDLQPRVGHPLLRVDPEVWRPVLEKTGSMKEAVSVAVAEDARVHEAFPLGDANGDRRADILHASWSVEDGSVVWEAISGRNWKPIWSIEPGETQYGFVMGDVDEDGVLDLALVSMEDDEGETSGFLGQGYSGTFTEHYEVISGRDGSTLFEAHLTGSFSFNYMGGGLLVLGAERGTFHLELSTLMDHPDAGVSGLLEWNMVLHDESTGAYLFPLVGFVAVNYWDMWDRQSVKHIGSDGSTVWSSGDLEFDGSVSWISDVADFTGDGISDYLVSTQGSGNSLWLYAGIIGLPSLGVELGGFSDEAQVLLVDGSDGSEVWRRTSDSMYLAETVAVGVGDVRGEGRDVVVASLGRTSLISEYGTRIEHLDGRTGAVVAGSWHENSLHLPLAFADVDGDALGEVLRVQIPISSNGPEGVYDLANGMVGVAKLDGEYLWSIKNLETVYPGFDLLDADLAPDLDGDGIPEVLLIHEQDEWGSLVPHHGVTGEKLWKMGLHDFYSFSFTGDVDGVGDLDVVQVIPNGRDAGTPDLPAGTYITLQRGSDLAYFWSKPLHTHVDSEEDMTPMVYAQTLGDVNGDGVPDLVMNLARYGMVEIVETVEPVEPKHSEVEGGMPMSLVAVVDGASGRILHTWHSDDDSDVEELLSGKVILGPVGKSLMRTDKDEGIPGPSLLAGVVALAAAVVLRRRW